jgi:hypothetical protein
MPINIDTIPCISDAAAVNNGFLATTGIVAIARSLMPEFAAVEVPFQLQHRSCMVWMLQCIMVNTSSFTVRIIVTATSSWPLLQDLKLNDFGLFCADDTDLSEPACSIYHRSIRLLRTGREYHHA